MSLRRLIVLAAVLGLALSCSRTPEPGVYTVQEGFVRVFVDSLGNTKALMYRDTSGVWADTLTVDLKAEKLALKPYEAPEFRLFPTKELYREPMYRVGEAHDIIYGRVIRNDSYDEDERMDLTMDVYVPEDGGQVARPLIVNFHGGAFKDGDKRDSTLVNGAATSPHWGMWPLPSTIGRDTAGMCSPRTMRCTGPSRTPTQPSASS